MNVQKMRRQLIRSGIGRRRLRFYDRGGLVMPVIMPRSTGRNPLRKRPS